jgi:hypothetical protein
MLPVWVIEKIGGFITGAPVSETVSISSRCPPCVDFGEDFIG